MSAPRPDLLQRLAIEHECTELVNGFARALDFSDQDHFLELFTADADLVYGATHTGLEAIARFVGTRPRSLRTRHVMSNVWIDVIDADDARGVAYCTLYAAAAGTPAAATPDDGTRPVAVGHVQDRYSRTEDGWRIARRSFHWAFGAPPD